MPPGTHPFRVQRSTFSVSAFVSLLAAVVFFVLLTLPAAPRHVTGADAELAGRTVGGAFHVHTNRSDGSGDKASVARAARRARLRFVVFTDHGDGTRPADPPEYLDDVLCIEGVEISTDGGHYIAVGASPAPYPLGGDSAAVVEDVARLGGFGVVAHPVSPRSDLAWTDWSTPFDALEWINADSEWRDESRWTLARTLTGYPIRASAALASLLDRPSAALDRWDSVVGKRRVLAIAGHDAHGGIGQRVEDPRDRRHIRLPSYAASFGAFSTRVELDRPFTGDAASDGRALVEALRRGTFYTEIDAVASGSTLAFTGRTGVRPGSDPRPIASQGSLLQGDGPAVFTARAAVPPDAEIVAFRNGAEIARAPGGSLEFESAALGAYRIEVHVAGAPGNPPVPWLVSNPILRLAAAAVPAPFTSSTVVTLSGPWRIEKDPASEGTHSASPAGSDVEFQYRLRAGERASQFAALVTDLPAGLPAFDAVTFVAHAAAPRRIAVQFRFAGDRDARWIKSVYVDSVPRTVTVRTADLRRADGPEQRPDLTRATSLLFVVDLTNARPGDRGTVTIGDLRLVKAAG